MSITSLDGYLMLAKSFSVDSLFSVGLAKSRDSIYSFAHVCVAGISVKITDKIFIDTIG
jgi:hypothetical protein